MTRRGSFAYYFVAVAFGSFCFALSFYAHWIADYGWEGMKQAGRDFLFLYFIAVAAGIFPLLLSAFLLRRITARLDWERAWQWVLAGTVAALAVVWALALVGLGVERAYFPQEWQNFKNWFVLLLVGPIMTTTGKPLWFPMPAAAATAYLLFRVHARFNFACDADAPPSAG